MSSPISLFLLLSTTLLFYLAPSIAMAQSQENTGESDIWHEIELYCDANAREAIITIRGTSALGLHETPVSIAQLTTRMQLEPGGSCRWSDGRLLHIEIFTPPYDVEGRCGSEPPGGINLTLADQAIFQNWQYFDCHRGYSASAVILHESTLRLCTGETECAKAGKLLGHTD